MIADEPPCHCNQTDVRICPRHGVCYSENLCSDCKARIERFLRVIGCPQ